MNLKLTGQLGGIALVLVFMFVMYGLLSKTDQPMKYITSPITIVTVLVLVLALMGVLKLNVWLLLIMVGLMILVMYQDDLNRFWDDLKDTWESLRKTVNKPGKDEREEVKKKFMSKYAEYKSEKDFYVYMRQVDDTMREIVGRTDYSDGTLFNNYYVVVLPEIISIDSGKPLGDKTSEKLTLWAIKHEAEVPIVHNGKVYTVRARAYLIKKYVFEEFDPRLVLFGPIVQFFDAFSGHPGKKHITNFKYSDFKQYLAEHSFNLPDKLYFEGVW